MATVTKPIALDESMNTTESPSRNVADVLAQELSGIASAITGGSDKVPKTDVATVEPSTTASRSYSVGELVYVNGNLYKVIASISLGSAFTVGTNIQSTTVSGAIGTGDRGSVSVASDGTKSVSQLLDSLFTLADFTKLTSKSALQISLSATVVMNLVYAVSDGIAHTFSRAIVDGASSNTLIDTVSIKSSGSSWYRSTITTTATYSNRSSTTIGSGLPITLYY